jgi:DUF1009 family protein
MGDVGHGDFAIGELTMTAESDSRRQVMASRKAPLAILAGGGDFPLLVAETVAREGRAVMIFGIVGEASARIETFPHVWLRRGQLGLLFGRMRAHGIVELVMIGGIRERRMPRLNEVDLGGLWGVLRNIRLLKSGDDSVLRFVANIIESRGFRVVGAADMAPALAISAGVKTRSAPDAADWRDIDVGLIAAKAHGATDRGQAVIARDGTVLVRETAAGTDAMLEAVCSNHALPTASGVLVKCLKPYQDRRLDMPAIGLETVERAAAAGLRGIAVGAGETLVADLPAVIAALDRFGMFLVGVGHQGRIAQVGEAT